MKMTHMTVMDLIGLNLPTEYKYNNDAGAHNGDGFFVPPLPRVFSSRVWDASILSKIWETRLDAEMAEKHRLRVVVVVVVVMLKCKKSIDYEKGPLE